MGGPQGQSFTPFFREREREREGERRVRTCIIYIYICNYTAYAGADWTGHAGKQTNCIRLCEDKFIGQRQDIFDGVFTEVSALGQAALLQKVEEFLADCQVLPPFFFRGGKTNCNWRELSACPFDYNLSGAEQQPSGPRAQPADKTPQEQERSKDLPLLIHAQLPRR